MLQVTCIHLDNGEFALYLNGHYLASEDGSGERWCLDDIRERLSLLFGVVMENVERKVPEDEEWSWNDVADSVFPLPDVTARAMTVDAFKGCRNAPHPRRCAGSPLHGASVPQPVATGRAFSPRLFGVVVILRHPVALKERPSSRFRGISSPSKSRRLRYSTVSLTRTGHGLQAPCSKGREPWRLPLAAP